MRSTSSPSTGPAVSAADTPERGARSRRHRHGRQRPLGQTRRGSPASRATGPARRLCSTWVAGGHPDRCEAPQRLRLLDRELEALARGGALSHGLQPRRPAPPRDQLNDWGVRVRWAGRRPRLWRSVIKELEFAERLTAGNEVLTLTMCINYGGRNEITDAVRAARRRGCRGPADAIRHHREGPSSARCTPPTCPTSTSSCAARASSARATSCSGRAPMPSWSFLTRCGRTSPAWDLWQAVTLYAARNRRFGGAIDAPNE